MPHTVRVNLANAAELLELPGIGPEQARAILEFRAQHGPILRPWSPGADVWEHVDFAPADSTAPEAPGA